MPWETLPSNHSSSSSFLISTFSRGASIGTMSSPIGARSMVKVFVCGLHFFAEVEIEDVVFDVNWNELFPSVPNLPIVRSVPSFPGHCCCALEARNRRLIPKRILMFFTSDSTRAAQRTSCTFVSLPSKIGTSRCHRNLETAKLHRQEYAHSTGRAEESSASCSIWTKVSRKGVHRGSQVQVHLHPFKPLGTARCTVKASQRK